MAFVSMFVFERTAPVTSCPVEDGSWTRRVGEVRVCCLVLRQCRFGGHDDQLVQEVPTARFHL